MTARLQRHRWRNAWLQVHLWLGLTLGGADALVAAHRLASILVLLIALAAAWTVRADRARAATILVCALGAFAMGVAATLRQPSLVGTVAHNAFAALLAGALAGAATARR